jgi:hypothetical protein
MCCKNMKTTKMIPTPLKRFDLILYILLLTVSLV